MEWFQLAGLVDGIRERNVSQEAGLRMNGSTLGTRSVPPPNVDFLHLFPESSPVHVPANRRLKICGFVIT
jgi:hypothetical protein